jgi:hypothetical protein
MKHIIHFLFVFLLSSCDNKSAVDSGEFLVSSTSFSQSRMKRCSLYLRPYKDQENYWKEAELLKAAKAVTVVGKKADNVWRNLEREVMSSTTRAATERKVELPLVFENEKGEKYQVRIDSISRKDKDYLFVILPGGESSRWIEIDKNVFADFLPDIISSSSRGPSQ